MIPKEKITSILATDCGSTTTKAILFEKVGDTFRLIKRGEAPTTVEAPIEDVTKGVINAVHELEDLVGRKLLDDNDQLIKPKRNNEGVDIYISTSSAGGGLQMMVAGVVKAMTAESAQRAALGAGAIVMDVIATNDNRLPHEQIEKIRHLRPDMILLAGGIDGGTTEHVAKLSELIAAADPKPRLGISYKLPIVYAGNNKATDIVKERLEQKTELDITENLRPTLEKENLMPARQKIQALFLHHVMQQAPGYNKLMKLTDVEIMPTPGAVGDIMQLIAKRLGMQVVGADIGGATTDVFSVFQGIYNKTVSANYGMSYSISNVFVDAGLENIMRWVPFSMDEGDLRNRIKNKMIRPTTVPYLLKELIIEQAVAREALRLSFDQHKALAVGLKGVQKERTIGDALTQSDSGESLVNLLGLNMLIGSGGVLSHAPRRQQAAMMLIDSFLPEGITQLTVDSIFMMPQLGVLAKVHPEAALQIFDKDCFIYLGTCIAPIGNSKDGKPCVNVKLTRANGQNVEIDVPFGTLHVIPLPTGESADVVVTPARGFDMGEGSGVKVSKKVFGGETGVIIDTRGRRPFELPKDNKKRVEKLLEWIKIMDLYPKYPDFE
ncbi:MAG: glutamate mutase L [Candidatus Wallbacteria bacterium]